MIRLKLKVELEVPLEAECISPDVFADKSLQEICDLPVHYGRHVGKLSSFFDIDGQPGGSLYLEGNLEKARWLGRAMSHGSLQVNGNIGMHLGAFMRGGEIVVHGDTSDWLGAEMRGGRIRIQGNAGNQVGSAYRGSLSGMRNGFISITGNAGVELGRKMRRGTIVVAGKVGNFVGFDMKGGTILLEQGAKQRVGEWMRRGTIVAYQSVGDLPGFNFQGPFESPFLAILQNYLERQGVPANPLTTHHCERYLGDRTRDGKGEVLLFLPQSKSRTKA